MYFGILGISLNSERGKMTLSRVLICHFVELTDVFGNKLVSDYVNVCVAASTFAEKVFPAFTMRRSLTEIKMKIVFYSCR